jgi:hypothetical protein
MSTCSDDTFVCRGREAYPAAMLEGRNPRPISRAAEIEGDIAMSDNDASGIEQTTQQAQPNPDLQTLDRLVGTWTVSGEAEGTVTYEWTENGFFLLQHVDLGGNRGLEVIGHESKYGEEPSADIRSRYYGFSEGETLDYTYEIVGDTLTIWMGERGSPAYYEGTFDEAGNALTGAWHYPGGGGYTTLSTRVG